MVRDVIVRNPGGRSALAGAALAVLAFAASAALAADHAHQHHQHHEHHQHHAAPAGDDAPSTVNIKLHDLELLDQYGAAGHFRSDVIGERIAVINFIYTSCTTVCPVASAIFSQVQQKLGERLGKDIVLVSLSVDPVTDRPARLHAYAQKHDAGDGWLWLTGDKLSMDQVLQGLGAYTPNYQDHPAMVLVGDGESGEWTRLFGFPSPDKIIAEVDALAAARERNLSAVDNR